MCTAVYLSPHNWSEQQLHYISGVLPFVNVSRIMSVLGEHPLMEGGPPPLVPGLWRPALWCTPTPRVPELPVYPQPRSMTHLLSDYIATSNSSSPLWYPWYFKGRLFACAVLSLWFKFCFIAMLCKGAKSRYSVLNDFHNVQWIKNNYKPKLSV